MNNNTFEVLAEGSEEGELADVESFKFSGLVADAKVSLQETTFNKSDYPSYVSLLACSKRFGYFVAGHEQGFVFGQTKTLRTTIFNTQKGSTSSLEDKTVISCSLPVHQLRLSCDELTVLAALSDGSIVSFRVTDMLEKKENATPIYTVRLDKPIIDLRPNTEASPDSACVLFQGNQCRIINWKSGETIADITGSDYTAICWSPKGKQVACGRMEGTVEHYDLSGIKRDSLPSPESMQAGYGDEEVNRLVQDILWIENHQFLIVYARPSDPGSDEFVNDAYVVDRKPKIGTGPKYTKLAEITPIFSPEGRSNHFYMETIRNFGSRFPHVIILANGATNEVSVVGEEATGRWATWDLPENGMASLPLSEETNFDTFPLGLALDFTADELLPPYDASESDVGVNPVPILYHLNDEGHIGSFYCYNDDIARSGEKYQGMQTPISPLSASEAPTQPVKTATTPASTTTPPAPSLPFGTKQPTTFSPSAFSSGPFGAALQSGSSGTSFASLSKVQGASIPAFGGGGSQGFGSLAKNTVANAVTPTFGSTTSFGSLSTASSASAFGSAGFGSWPKGGSAPTPAFGSTTSLGSSASPFGSTSLLGSTAAAPAFGSTTGFEPSNTTTSAKGPGFGKIDAETATTNKQEKPELAAAAQSLIDVKVKEEGETKETAAELETEATKDGSPATSGSSSSFEIVNNKDTTDKGTPPAERDDFIEPEKESAVPIETAAEPVAIAESTNIDVEETQQNEKLPPSNILIDDSKSEAVGTAKATTAAPKTQSPSLGGFGALAKNTVPGAQAPSTSFGSSFGKGITPQFGTPATTNNTPNFGLSSSTFGKPATLGSSSGGFGALAKNTVPGAVTPVFGSSSGGFGALAKNTATDVTVPTFGSSSTFGSTTTITSPLKATPMASTNITSSTAATVTPASAKPSQLMTAPIDKEPALTPKPAGKLQTSKTISDNDRKITEPSTPKPEAEEGMAKEFECIYFTITAELKKLSTLQTEYEKQLNLQKVQQREQEKVVEEMSESVRTLTESMGLWRLGALEAVVRDIDEQLQNSDIKDQKKTLADLQAKSLELITKKEQIKQCLDSKEDEALNAALKDRALDGPTSERLEKLEKLTEDNDHMLKELEYRTLNKKNMQNISAETDTTKFSFYDFHCAIRDVERDLKRKDAEVRELEHTLSLLRFRENQRKAEESPSRITFEDLTDDEDEDDAQTASANNDIFNQFTDDHINYTVKYIKDEQFLDKLCSLTSQRPPISFNVSDSNSDSK